MTYRKIAKTQKSSDEAGPASQEDGRGFGNRALVPNTSIRESILGQGLVLKGANNQNFHV